MQVQKIQQDNQITKQQPQFKSIDGFLRYLAVNQAVGANGVDLCCMVTPRTASDMIKRGPVAGMETLRRESMGTVNDSLIGVYGAVAGIIVGSIMGMNKKYGNNTVNFNDILAAPETLNILAKRKTTQLVNKQSNVEYLKEVLRNMKAFNPNAKFVDAEGYVRLSDTSVEEIAQILDDVIQNKDMTLKQWTKGKTNNSIHVLINKITEQTGAQSEYVIDVVSHDGIKYTSTSNLETLLKDIFNVSKAFENPTVKKTFEEQIKIGNVSIRDNVFMKALNKFKNIKSYAGFGIAAAVGLSVQPINMYLTKRKTGSDGFVGVEGREKDKSTGFFLTKVASALAFMGMDLWSLNNFKGKPVLSLSGFMDKMAFKGFWPTINQLKGVFGITIISRIFSARDKDELRESLTKDTLGFFSWLILGDIVNKATAEIIDKSVMNRNSEVAKKGFWSRIYNSKLKTRDEILIETLHSKGVSTIKEEGGQKIAKTFKEMLNDLKTSEKIPEELKKLTKKRLGVLNKAQLAGYAFSALVLGLGIPNLNIWITNTLDKKKKAKQAAEEQKAQVAMA
ncbi:MAG: hypothetical protein MJ231_08545 [bacterium]|nr:hypothetical protein [bacterium]